MPARLRWPAPALDLAGMAGPTLSASA